MINPLVTVIIPTYNRSAQINKALESVLNQSYSNLEILIIDDGSTDDTETKIREVYDERIKYIKMEENQGSSAARNQGILLAQGEYIAFHDSDDIMHLDRIEMQMLYIIKNNAEMVFGQVKRIDMQGNIKGIFPKTFENLDNKRDTYLSFLKEGVVWTPTVLGKTKAIKNILFDVSMPNRVDMDWSIRFAKQYKIVFQNKIVVDSYIQKNSISQNQKNALKATEIMYGKYYKDIENSRELMRIWTTEMEQFRWNLQIEKANGAWNAFRYSKDYRWLVKTVGLFCLGKKFYKLIGKKKNE